MTHVREIVGNVLEYGFIGLLLIVWALLHVGVAHLIFKKRVYEVVPLCVVLLAGDVVVLFLIVGPHVWAWLGGAGH